MKRIFKPLKEESEEQKGEVRKGIDERKKGQFDIMAWIIRQQEYARFSNKGPLKIAVRAGEIYEIDFGVNVNAEFSYRHYGLVLADSSENDPLVLVVPLKSNIKGGHPASDLNLGIIECLDKERESLAVLNQVKAIDKMRIFRKPIIQLTKYGYENNERLFDSENHQIEKNPDITYAYTSITYRLEERKFQDVLKGFFKYVAKGSLIDND